MAEKTQTYTLEELRKMPTAVAQALILKAVKVSGTAIVRRADGSIKYDEPERAGQYGEPSEGDT